MTGVRRIQLEGNLELVETLLQQWEQAVVELRHQVLPGTQTVAALRVAKQASDEAIERAKRHDETRATFAALERARLASSGIPSQAKGAQELLRLGQSARSR